MPSGNRQPSVLFHPNQPCCKIGNSWHTRKKRTCGWLIGKLFLQKIRFSTRNPKQSGKRTAEIFVPHIQTNVKGVLICCQWINLSQQIQCCQITCRFYYWKFYHLFFVNKRSVWTHFNLFFMFLNKTKQGWRCRSMSIWTVRKIAPNIRSFIVLATLPYNCSRILRGKSSVFICCSGRNPCKPKKWTKKWSKSLKVIRMWSSRE